MAVMMRDNTVIDWLVEKGANPHIEDINNEDCCDYAFKYKVDHEAFNRCDFNKRVPCKLKTNL